MPEATQAAADQVFDRVSHPAKRSLTLNRLIVDSLLRMGTSLPEDFQNLNALLNGLRAPEDLEPTYSRAA